MDILFGGIVIHPTTRASADPRSQGECEPGQMDTRMESRGAPFRENTSLVLERGHWGLGTVHLWVA